MENYFKRDDSMDDQETSQVPAVVSSAGIVKPVQSVSDVVAMAKQLQDFVGQALTQDEDYGIIPGCGKKPSLLKPGAEKLCNFFGLGHRTAKIEKTEIWNKDDFFFAYDYTVEVFSLKNPGIVIADSTGHANSQESKWSEKNVYKNGKLIGKSDTTYREMCGKVNTIKKIAEKRAFVSAVIKATRASHNFTMDIEDPDVRGGQEQNNGVMDNPHSQYDIGTMILKFGEFKGRTVSSLNHAELTTLAKGAKGTFRQKVLDYGIKKFGSKKKPKDTHKSAEKPKEVGPQSDEPFDLNDMDTLNEAIEADKK